MIDAEFVGKIEALANKANTPVKVDIGDNQTAVYVGGQRVESFTKPEPFGGMAVADFASFVDAAEFLVDKAETAVIKVTSIGMHLICDQSKPHKLASVDLIYQPTSAYGCLQNWMAGQKNVATINKLLRTKLFGTFDEKLISIFRQIEFARAGATTVSKTTHRDTMGKSIDNAVKSAAGEIPEVLLFATRLLQNVPCEVVDLRFYVDVNHDNETIGIAPLGDSIEEAMQSTLASLIERLKSDFPKVLVVAS